MHINRKVIGVGAVVVFCLLCSVIAYRASASRNMAARPTAVAVVNLRVLLDGLNQRSDAEIRIGRMEEEIRAEGERRATFVEGLQKEYDEIPESDAEARRAKGDQIMLENLNNQAWLRLNAEKLDIEKSLSWQDLDRSIRQAVAALAAADGWEVVLVDDSLGELRSNPNAQLSREAQVTQQMTSRRILYADSAVNITDQLITRMNNAYQSGG
ncbi:MAG: OmpH family outer membrane protein [Phycisphaerales bacterium]|nr:MAG: OmpH family outer membrane protein [Phycisphaerales bacterium]